MRARKWLSFLLALTMLLSLLPVGVLAAGTEQGTPSGDFRIVVGANLPEMQEYAAKELRKYLFQLSGEDVEIITAADGMDLTNAFVLGTLESNPLVEAVQPELDGLKTTGAKGHEGEQGYVLKKVGDTLYIAGTDDEGLLYGVYGLLDDYYGIGFYFSGDVIPEQKTALTMPEVNEAKTPQQYMRGILPWTNFPQSSTVYSTEDWMYIIDQMARMRMNFLNIHNYNGQSGHNEIFHNFTYNGITSRNWNATASTGHSWSCPGWDVNEYRFGATDLFDDYDFGADATLHNENLDNLANFAKGWSQFQTIIEYAHSRGVKMGLGLDINLVMPDYGVACNAENLPETSIKTLLNNYPELDTVILYISETVLNYPSEIAKWEDCFQRMYDTIQEEKPDLQVAVSGWGIRGSITDFVRTVSKDIVIAPIADYSSGFVNGVEEYGEDAEFWGGPWMERDFQSSLYFYPFRMGLDYATTTSYAGGTVEDGTIPSYEVNQDTMAGIFTLTWRLTDGVDAKLGYIAKAPWEQKGEFAADPDDTQSVKDAARAVYREYVEKCYGVGLSEATIEDLTQLVYEDEPQVVPTLWSECEATPAFTGQNRQSDIDKAQSMIDRVDKAMAESRDDGCIARLQKLRDRLVCAQYYCKLDQSFNTTAWEDLQQDFSVWVRSFMTRVDDISSLGNNESVQNRFVQERYLARETSLRNQQTVKAPLNVVAKATASGAVLTWEYEDQTAQGFKIYRNGAEIAAVEDVRTYSDPFDGEAVYTVTALVDGEESVASIAQTVLAGSANNTAPQAIVVSPSTSLLAGQDLKVKARLLDDNVYEELSAVIHYRALGSQGAFTQAPMEHRVKSTFTANVASDAFVNTGMEYYLTVSDGRNESVWPATGGENGLNAVCTVVTNRSQTVLRAPTGLTAQNGGISWNAGSADVHWYKIYRGDTAGFMPSAANFVTYVEAGTTCFQDTAYDFDGSKLTGSARYYRVTAVDSRMNESLPSQAVLVRTVADPMKDNYFIHADTLYNSQVAAQPGSALGSVVGYTKAGGYAAFENLTFPSESAPLEINGVEVTYAAPNNYGGTLEVRLDSPNGTLLGTGDLTATGSWGEQGFGTVTITLSPKVTGTHTVYFVYGGKAAFNLDYFRFVHVEEAPEGLTITPHDMMGERSKTSPLKEKETEILSFGNEGDRITLGKGFRMDDPGVTFGTDSKLFLAAEGDYGYNTIGWWGIAGSYVQFTDVPAGKLHFGYDMYVNSASNSLTLERNGETATLTLEPTDSNWGLGIYNVRYTETGVTAAAGDTVRITSPNAAQINPTKLFVEQSYAAEQLNIVYANKADTQFSLYVDGMDTGVDVVLPNSNGSKVTQPVVCSVNGVISFRMDDADLTANGGTTATIYSVSLLDKAEAGDQTYTIAVTYNQEGGTVTAKDNTIADGKVTVAAGASQSFTMTPNRGYEVQSVLVNGTDIGGCTSYTFEGLRYNAALEVVFAEKAAQNEYDVTVDPAVRGRITADVTYAQQGQVVTVTISEDADDPMISGTLRYVTASHPEGVAINERNLQFLMPGEDVVITATFQKAWEQTVLDEAKTALQGGSYTVDQETANTEAAVRTWLVPQLNRLLQETGLKATEADVTITAFTAASAGDREDPNGTDGSFSFTVALTKGTSSDTAACSGTIRATVYTPPQETAAPAFAQDTQTFASAEARTVTFTLTVPVAGTYRVYNTAGEPLTEPQASVQGNKLTLTFQNQPSAAETFLVTAQEEGKSESAGTAVTVMPYVAPKSSENDILSFEIAGGETAIDGAEITVTMPAGTDVTALTPAITVSDKATVSPASGETKDFTEPVIYTVTAEDGGAKTYTVTVLVVKAPVDKSALEELYNANKDKQQGNYTDASWEALQAALDNAKAVLDNEAATQEEVDAAEALLREAIAGLTEKPTYPVLPIIPGNSTNKPNNEMSFTDVSKGDRFYEDIKYVYDNGIMNGVSDTRFAPESTLTRAMVVTILYRMEGEPAVRYNALFSDVENYQWYTEGVEWAVNNGIVLGYTTGKFGPNDPVTREQLAAILYRYAQSKNYVLAEGADLSNVTDASNISPYAVTAVKWSVTESLLESANGKLLPRETATRAEVAHAIAGFCQNVGE